MKFLVNENFPITSVNYLRAKNFDILAVAEVLRGGKDSDILDYAVKEERIIITFDRDYGELIYRYRITDCPGIIYLKFTPVTPEQPAEYILNILNQDIELRRKFTVVESQRIRQRALDILQA